MSMSNIVPAFCFIGMLFLVTKCTYTTMTTPEPKHREQYVIELDCGDYTRYLWKPVNTIGIAYRADGREVGDIPSCLQTSLGKVDEIGDFKGGDLSGTEG